MRKTLNIESLRVLKKDMGLLSFDPKDLLNQLSLHLRLWPCIRGKNIVPRIFLNAACEESDFINLFQICRDEYVREKKTTATTAKGKLLNKTV